MNATISTLFYLKNAKTNKKGLTPVYLRVTIDGKRFEMATNRFVDKTKWSSEAKKIKGNSEEARSINEYLRMFEANIYEAQKNLILESKEVTFETIRNRLLKLDEQGYTIIEVFEQHNEKMKSLIGIDYSDSTYKRFETTLDHVKNYLKLKHKISDIRINNIDYSFVTGFDYYLRTDRKCNNNTTVKYVKNLGKIIKLCLANGWITKDPFANYKPKIKEVEREILTEKEIEALMNKTFISPRLELVRDIFVFSCFTGLAYIDVKQLSKENIGLGIDGDKWIFKHRQKTDTASKIPLLPTAQIIIDKYAEHPVCKNENCILPVLSNQKMNAYLKEIADVCGINKDLTFHIARHTFATTVTLSNGVPLETVSKMLGHTDLKTTQHYAKILDKKISEDMKILRDKFSTVSPDNKQKTQ